MARGALRLAERLGLLRVQERRRRAARSDTNVVTITAKGWWRWLKRVAGKVARTAALPFSRPDAVTEGGGCGYAKATSTEELGRDGQNLPHRRRSAKPTEKRRGEERTAAWRGMPRTR